MVDEIKKRGRGRPKGASQRTLAPITIITQELTKSLEILNSRGKSLAFCLADEFEQSPSRVLTAVSRYLPTQIQLDVNETNPFLQSLREINDRIEGHKTIEHEDEDENSN